MISLDTEHGNQTFKKARSWVLGCRTLLMKPHKWTCFLPNHTILYHTERNWSCSIMVKILNCAYSVLWKFPYWLNYSPDILDLKFGSRTFIILLEALMVIYREHRQRLGCSFWKIQIFGEGDRTNLTYSFYFCKCKWSNRGHLGSVRVSKSQLGWPRISYRTSMV